MAGALAVACVIVTTAAGCSPGADSGASRPTSAAQGGRLLEACLHDKGWDARIEADGGVVSEYPPEQGDRYTADLSTCLTEHGMDEPFEYSPEELKELYAELLTAQTCLYDEFGYDTPKAPSLTTFVEAEGAWTPFMHLPDMSAEDFAAIERLCPQPGA